MEKVYDPPFRSLGHALSHWNNAKPARQVFPNLLDLDRSSRTPVPDFSGISTLDRWAALTGAIHNILKQRPEQDRLIWLLRNFGDTARHKAVEDVAEALGLSLARIKRSLARTNKEIAHELRRRALIPWEIERWHNGTMTNGKRITIAKISGDALALGLNNVRIEPCDDGTYELVGYTPQGSEPVAIYPGDGAMVTTQEEIRKSLSA